jgi:Tfp pilus assembly protein PilF
MTPDQWARVKEIFDAALERSPKERSEYLVGACSGDELIHSEVLRLLALDRARGFLDSPAWAQGDDPVLAAGSHGQAAEAVAAPPVSTILQTGETFANRYEIQGELGRGGFGVVYSAFDRGPLQRIVALKVIRLASEQPSELTDLARRRFLEEARVAGKLSHSNIATVFDVGESAGCVYMTQELAPGRDLRKILGESGAMPVRRTVAIARQICEGLAHAHSRGVVHRDIKPGNIVVGEEDRVKVTDFGLAQSPQGEDSALSQVIAGTPGYMAPEQFARGHVDERADIFAVGCVLYQMLTAHQPFEGTTTITVIENTLNAVPAAPSQVRKNLPHTLDRIVSRAMRKNPEERYHHIAQLQQDLVKFEQGAWRGWVAAAAAVALVVALSAVLYFRLSHRPPALTEKDTVVLADFTNQTGDTVFDGALKQGLAVALRQSPFLNVLSDSRVAAMLRLMQRAAGTPVTGQVAREVCQRAGSRAYIAGSIAALGSQYVLGLKAVGCADGETLAEQQATASGKENVLNALGQEAAKLREELGESLASVRKFDTPLAQAATSSLEALKVYSQAAKAQTEQGSVAALPFFARAIELDPSFASANAGLGINYGNLGQTGRSREYFAKAFALREHTSEGEKLSIEALYYYGVTGELEKADQAFQEWIGNYPRAVPAYTNLSAVRLQEGDYAGCVALNRQALGLNPNNVLALEDLGTCLSALGGLDEARKTLEEGLSRKLDDYGLHAELYTLAFLAADTQGMSRQALWFEGKPDVRHEIISLEANTEAYGGHLAKARALTQRAVEGAVPADNLEAAGEYHLDAALREAAFGNAAEARREAQAALKLAPDSRDVQAWAALADAWAGDEAGARKLDDDLKKRFPLDTLVNGYWLPTTEARMKLAENHPAEALDQLQAVPYLLEQGEHSYAGALYPVYTRGAAHLAAGQGSAAAGEFQKILDRPGIVLNCPIGALAHLGLARAYGLQAGLPVAAVSHREEKNRPPRAPLQPDALAKARAAYQDFFRLWKDADPEIPILKQAKAEYAKLH